MTIKVLLVLALVGYAYVALSQRRSRPLSVALRRAAALLLASTGIVAVIWPDVTVWAARHVGVARGTDLVFYLAVVGGLFIAVSLFQRMHDLERRQVEIIRELALRAAVDKSDH